MLDVLTEFVDRVRPSHTAVVVVDMQNDFCATGGALDKTHGCDAAANRLLADNISAVVAAARAGGSVIVWVQAIYDDKYIGAPMLAKNVERGVTETRCAEGSWGADFYAVAPEPGDLFIEKHCYSAFIGTRLDGMLRGRGVKTLVVVGVSTNVCVESTLRDGLSLGYYIVVPEDCVASPAADLHQATLQNVRNLLGDVTSADALVSQWSAEDAPIKRTG